MEDLCFNGNCSGLELSDLEFLRVNPTSIATLQAVTKGEYKNE